MPRKKQPWFRFYTEAVGDPKLRRLPPAQRWLWVAVLAAARQSPVPGVLMLSERCPLTVADLADYASMRVKDVEAGMAAMDELGLTEFDSALNGWFVVRWSDRQYSSDDVTERTRRHRLGTT